MPADQGARGPMMKLIRAFVIAVPLSLLLPAGAALADMQYAQDGYWTYGLGIGELRTSQLEGERGGGEYSFTDRNRRYNFHLGYQFHPNFDFEVGYIDGGWHRGSFTDPDGDSQDINGPLREYRIRFGVRFPVNSRFRMYARAGLSDWRVSVYQDGIDSIADREGVGEIGVEWQPHRDFGVRFGADKYEEGGGASYLGMFFRFEPRLAPDWANF